VIYLASPFCHPVRKVMEWRARLAREVTVYLMGQGYDVFSPIVYSQALRDCGLNWRHERWLAFDMILLRSCGALWVLAMDGWQESQGVRFECDVARRRGVPPFLLWPVRTNGVLNDFILEPLEADNNAQHRTDGKTRARIRSVVHRRGGRARRSAAR
jgi:hypothetical protein